MSNLVIVLLTLMGMLLATAIAMTPVWLALYRTRVATRTLKQLAIRLNGHVYGGTLFAMPRIAVQDHGQRFDLRVDSPKSDSSRKILYLSGPWPGDQTRVMLYPESFWTRANKFMGLQDLLIGEPEFDHTFVIQGNSHQELLDLLKPDVQGLLINAWTMSPTISLSIAGGQICLAIETDMNQASMTGQFSSFLDLRRRMLHNVMKRVHAVNSKPSELQFKMAHLKTESATCLVCGTEVSRIRVSCRRCQTPHHRDCWGYFGGCSRYGCGETVFLDPK